MNTADGKEVAVGYPIEGGKIGATLTDGDLLPFKRNYTIGITACNVIGCTSYEGNITISEWP